MGVLFFSDVVDLEHKIQAIAKLKNSLNILAIFPGKAFCAVEAGPEKAGGTLSRVTFVVPGLLKRLAQQALNGHAARIFPTISRFAII